MMVTPFFGAQNYVYFKGKAQKHTTWYCCFSLVFMKLKTITNALAFIHLSNPTYSRQPTNLGHKILAVYLPIANIQWCCCKPLCVQCSKTNQIILFAIFHSTLLSYVKGEFICRNICFGFCLKYNVGTHARRNWRHRF